MSKKDELTPWNAPLGYVRTIVANILILFETAKLIKKA